MTFRELSNIIKANNISDDVTLISDSKWECDPTEMNGVYYNKKGNVIVFTQYSNDECEYASNDEWVDLSLS